MCESIQVGERIRVILDCDDNTLAFEKNYEFLGNGTIFLWHVMWINVYGVVPVGVWWTSGFIFTLHNDF